MKYIAILFLSALFCSCTQQQPSKNASEEKSSVQPYKPGLGEIMSGIQMHHAKLWYAGINNNWDLSSYEVKEIRELLETAKHIETDRKEVADIPMIYDNLDSISASIQQKDLTSFKNSFLTLTNTCNACHRAVNFGFNIVTIPTAPPVSNQEFKMKP
jgi:hypothetical protein